MQTTTLPLCGNAYSGTWQQWTIARFENYRTKLGLTARKARKRLLVTGLEKEYDRICDSQFWSSNEPGISHEERKQRLKRMYKQPEALPPQLKHFYY